VRFFTTRDFSKLLSLIRPPPPRRLTSQEHARAPQGTAALVDQAVSAAAAAFAGWSREAPEARAAALLRLADALEARKETVASVEAFNTGKPFREAQGDVDDACAAFRYCARQAQNFEKRYPQPVEDLPDASFRGSTRYEAVGVVGAICPWNFPLVRRARAPRSPPPPSARWRPAYHTLHHPTTPPRR
jgi:betaine-aldehyde dehydrogenase